MGPLTGIKILDFSTLLPGPWATRQLADMGAEILRIESPRHQDMLRQMPAAFSRINQAKQTLSLDLTQPTAQQQVKQLLEEYDVVLEQFRPGVMAKFGLDYPSLSGAFPKLIYCSLTGYGQTGPYRDRAGHDINYLAVSGIAGYSGVERPTLSGIQLADLAGGSLQAIIAILSAIIERQQTGYGQYLDIAMADGALALNTLAAADNLEHGRNPGYATEWLNGGLFYDYYQCKDKKWLSLGGLEAKFIKKVCVALGKTEWEPRFLDFNPERQRGLKQDLAALFQTKSCEEWLSLLDDDMCVESVLTLSEAVTHPQFVARGMVKEVEGKQHLACPVKFPGSRLGKPNTD
jgi:crotonobetainyl-CoA:carnitine CoA-transferase CaiB-like acyl-CoA transferase